MLLTFLLLSVTGSILAQARTTNETKLTLVVNKENTKIIDLEIFDENEVANIKLRYPESKLFIGLLKGSFELVERKVKPNKGATITIFTERQFFPNEKFFQKEDLVKGDHLSIGNAKAKVISSVKGELILTTQ